MCKFPFNRQAIILVAVLLSGCNFGLACGPAAPADDKSHKAAAREVLKAMDSEKQLQASIDVTLDAMTKANPMLRENRDKIKKFLVKYMGWEGLEDDFVRIYVKSYTEDELNDIAAFYKTPTGKKMASKTAEITKQALELSQRKLEENQAELIRILTEK